MPQFMSYCLDCGAEFEKALAIGIAGGKNRYVCPECKSDMVRLKTPSIDMLYRIKIDIEEIDPDE